MAEPWLEGLNEQQRAAVEHDAGPVGVLAGPGTGKTRVITHRVARLVERDGVDPESIVAVTFTVRAANELRERLGKILGGQVAQRVRACTLHALGLWVLDRFHGSLGYGSRPRLVDSAHRKRLVRESLDEVGIDPAQAPFGREPLVPDVGAWIARFRQNAIEPADAIGAIESWEERLDRWRSDGPLTEEALEAERERLSRFTLGARAFEVYDRLMHERQWASFDELLTLPLRVLGRDSGAGALVRDLLRHFVIDEFQDLNVAQIKMLRLLAPPDRRPDLCVVGDDDQAIYAFRGADENAFWRFASAWEGARIVRLEQNYRSAPCVIEAGARIMSRAARRFDPDKRVVFAPVDHRGEAREAPAGSGVQCVLTPGDQGYAELVPALIRRERAAREGLSWADFGVIARTHGDLSRIAWTLELEGIPASAPRDATGEADEAIQDLLAWIELVVTPGADWSLQRLLARPPVAASLEQLSRWLTAHRGRLAGKRASGMDLPAFAESLSGQLDPRAPGAPARALALLRTLDELRELAGSASAHDMAFEIMRRARLGDASLLGEREVAKRVRALGNFLNFVESRGALIEPPGTLESFWRYYQDLDEREQRTALSVEERIDGLDEQTAGWGEDDSVRLLTAHGSKGLEFDTVIVPRANPMHGYPKTGGGSRDPDTRLPESLADRMDDERDEPARRLDEERRLFYVACTRAERRLLLVCKQQKSRSSATHFVHELMLDPAPDERIPVMGADEVFEQLEDAGAPPEGAVALGRATSLRDARDEIIERAIQNARFDAAGALGEAAAPGLSPEQVSAIGERLAESARQIAIAAHIGEHAETPAWASSDRGVAALLERLAVAEDGGSGGDGSGGLFGPLEAPLRLSYSAIDAYLRCPRCAYLKNVLGIREPESVALVLGNAAHKALYRYYSLWREADAEGREPPSRDALLTMGEEELIHQWPNSLAIDPDHVRRVRAMVASVPDSLHSATDNILFLERKARFTFESCGHEHTMTAALDRVDQMGDGRLRIVDYKTGAPRDALTSPEADDLQMGIYALALPRVLLEDGFGDTVAEEGMLFGDPTPPAVEGVAEYWLLTTGERGAVGLDALDMRAIREKIDKAVDGMLSGQWERTCKREGSLCASFG